MENNKNRIKSKIKTVGEIIKTLFSSGIISNKKNSFYKLSKNEYCLKTLKLRLKISDEQFECTSDISKFRVWDWDVKKNKICYFSQSTKTLELKRVDAIYQSEFWNQIVHPEDLEKYYAKIKFHFENKTSYFENYHRIILPAGEYKWILSKGVAVERCKDKNALRVIGMHIDISAQKEKELELLNKIEVYRKQKQRLLHFSHIVAHNLNTHIGNIKLLLDFNDLKEHKSNIETLKNLRTVSDDLTDTLTNLCQIVNIQNNQTIDIKPLEVNTCLNKVLSLISGYNYEHKATIVNNIPSKTIVNFNPAYLESVLLNFCTNAIRYAHPDRFPVIRFDFFMEDEKKVITITDNGLGIDLDKYGDLLFGMYNTFHKHKDAQGIGLYMTKIQIEAMKGKVSVRSKVGEGTTFKILFTD